MAERSRIASDRAHTRSRSTWWTSRWVVGLLLAVLAVVFILENRELAAIRLLVPVVIMPQWAALTTMLIVGVLLGVLLRRRR